MLALTAQNERAVRAAAPSAEMGTLIFFQYVFAFVAIPAW